VTRSAGQQQQGMLAGADVVPSLGCAFSSRPRLVPGTSHPPCYVCTAPCRTATHTTYWPSGDTGGFDPPPGNTR